MNVVTTVLASRLNSGLKSSENVSIVFVSRDNKSFALNLVSDNADRTDTLVPNSVILTEAPLPTFKILSRIVSPEFFTKDMFSSECRVIANSIEDKLKSFAIINELTNCL